MGERFSFSKLNVADHCLRRFQHDYDTPPGQGIPQLFDPLRDTGSAVHACIEQYKAHLQATGQTADYEQLSLIVEDVFSNSSNNFPTSIYDDVFWIFRSFARTYSHNPDKYIGSEFLLQRPLPESDITIEAYPDHVETQEDERGPIIVSEDEKTGYKSEVSPDNELQGWICAWLLMALFPEHRVGWRVNFTRIGKREAIVELQPAAVPRLEARLRSIVAKVQNARVATHFPATPGDHCRYCPLALQCVERNVAVNAKVLVDDPVSARQAGADFVLLSAALDRREAQLKKWAKDQGPVALSDTEEIGFIVKHGGPKIGDAAMLILQLGTREALAQQYYASPEEMKTEEALLRVTYLGLQVAFQMGLLSVNGNKTKALAVQNDERLAGLWVPGDTRNEFTVFAKENHVQPVK